MSNYIEFKNKIAFHPGYYIKEIIEESGITQEDYAKRLGTTPKNLSILIRGGQSLSIDMAIKLSRLLGTSVQYWMNLQIQYDTLISEFKQQEELEEERKILKNIDYKYFIENFSLPDLPRKINEQVEALRKFLNVSTLTTLKQKDMLSSFRTSNNINENNIIKANTMVTIATNKALQIQAPAYNKNKFIESIEYILTKTNEYNHFYSLIYDSFIEAGVIFVLMPNMKGSKINGVTKKVGKNILLMISDKDKSLDVLWFTLLHECYHILKNDFGITCDEKEKQANIYAQTKLIPEDLYKEFVKEGCFDVNNIKTFSNKINRNPSIVLGRLQNDNLVRYDDINLNTLKLKYKTST